MMISPPTRSEYFDAYCKKMEEQYPGLLTKQEETELFMRIARGAKCESGKKVLDSDARLAREKIIGHNYRLPLLAAFRFYDNGNLEDLIAVGNAELAHSVDKFEYQRGLRFSTFAVKNISGSMKRAIAFEIKASGGLYSEHNAKDYGAYYEEKGFRKIEEREDLKTALSFIHGRQAKASFVLYLRYLQPNLLEPLELKEVGKLLDISKERVRQLESMALAIAEILLKRDDVA